MLPFRHEAAQRYVIPRGLDRAGIARRYSGLVRIEVFRSQVQTPIPHESRVAELHRQLVALGGVSERRGFQIFRFNF